MKTNQTQRVCQIEMLFAINLHRNSCMQSLLPPPQLCSLVTPCWTCMIEGTVVFCNPAVHRLSCFPSPGPVCWLHPRQWNDFASFSPDLRVSSCHLTDQPLQWTAQWTQAAAPDRCGQTDLWPLQEQPQRFHWLPERESNPVWCLFCVVWPTLLCCQKDVEVSKRACQIPEIYFSAFVLKLLHNFF